MDGLKDYPCVEDFLALCSYRSRISLGLTSSKWLPVVYLHFRRISPVPWLHDKDRLQLVLHYRQIRYDYLLARRYWSSIGKYEYDWRAQWGLCWFTRSTSASLQVAQCPSWTHLSRYDLRLLAKAGMLDTFFKEENVKPTFGYGRAYRLISNRETIDPRHIREYLGVALFLTMAVLLMSKAEILSLLDNLEAHSFFYSIGCLKPILETDDVELILAAHQFGWAIYQKEHAYVLGKAGSWQTVNALLEAKITLSIDVMFESAVRCGNVNLARWLLTAESCQGLINRSSALKVVKKFECTPLVP